MEACFCAVEEGIVLPDGECIGLAAKCWPSDHFFLAAFSSATAAWAAERRATGTRKGEQET